MLPVQEERVLFSTVFQQQRYNDVVKEVCVFRLRLEAR